MKILYFLPSVPFPPYRGTAQRTDLLYRALCELGAVDTVLLRSPSEPPHDEATIKRLRDEFGLIEQFHLRTRGQMGPWRLIHRFAAQRVDRFARGLGDPDAEHRRDPAIQTWLRRQLSSSRYDLLVGRYLPILGQTGALEQTEVPVALDVDDLPSEMCRSRLATSRTSGLAHHLEKRRLRRLERTQPQRFARCSVLWVANDEHRRESGLERAQYLPNIPYFPERLPDPLPPNPDSKTLLFVGTFSHNPNLEGLNHFLQSIWPNVLAEEPAARLMLVGSKMTDAHKRHYAALPNVDAVGFVERLPDAYAQTTLSIVPVYTGSGTNIKLPESLAYGRTAVITEFAHRGHSAALPHDVALRIAKSDTDFAGQLVDLLKHPERVRRLAENGRQCVEQHYSFNHFKTSVQAPIESCLKSIA